MTAAESQPLSICIPTGEEITIEKLQRTEQAESFLSGLGFRDFRVRCQANMATIQVTENDLSLLMHYREDVLQELKKYYTSAVLDLEVRK